MTQDYLIYVIGAGVLGTWTLAALALWGEALRARFFKPRLRVQPKGLGAVVPQNSGLKSRYYIVQATNPTRFPTAHEVQIVLTVVEKPDVGGAPYREFDEVLYLSWVREELERLLTRTVGWDRDAALFFVREDGVLQFTPAFGICPNHFPITHRGKTTLWVTLRAVSIEADSPPVRLKIEWDGQWHLSEAELLRHLNVSVD